MSEIIIFFLKYYPPPLAQYFIYLSYNGPNTPSYVWEWLRFTISSSFFIKLPKEAPECHVSLTGIHHNWVRTETSSRNYNQGPVAPDSTTLWRISTHIKEEKNKETQWMSHGCIVMVALGGKRRVSRDHSHEIWTIFSRQDLPFGVCGSEKTLHTKSCWLWLWNGK